MWERDKGKTTADFDLLVIKENQFQLYLTTDWKPLKQGLNVDQYLILLEINLFSSRKKKNTSRLAHSETVTQPFKQHNSIEVF